MCPKICTLDFLNPLNIIILIGISMQQLVCMCVSLCHRLHEKKIVALGNS